MSSNSQPSTPSIGFIGIGHMGSLMVLRLLGTGYPVTVYDRTSERTQEVQQHGATVAVNPRELALHCDIVMSIVTDNQALEAVMHGPDGALAGARPGVTFIDLSTVSPEESRHIAQLVQEKGAQMIDAAVSGSIPQVKEGSLVIFVGGDREIYERCKPILDHLGKTVLYIGSHGMGTSMKMVVNTLLGLGLQAVAEAVALGEKAGIEKNLLLDVLAQTTVISPAHKLKLQNVRQEHYPVEFALALMRKDFSLVLRMAAELNVSMPATAAAEQAYAAALAQGPNEDYSSMFRFMEQMAGIPLTKEKI